MRTSSYVVYIDLPEDRDNMLLVHGYTGAYDRVSRSVATFLKSREKAEVARPLYGSWRTEFAASESARQPDDSTVDTLRRRGYLTSLSADDERSLVGRLAETAHQYKTDAAPQYIIMPTYNCNLRCSYCFQDHMRTDPSYGHLLSTMTLAMAERIIKAVPQVESLHKLQRSPDAKRRVGFFGGEPFLAANRPVVEYLVSSFRALGPTALWAVTNGTELEHYKDLLSPDVIASLQITLDGIPAEHDRRRVYPDGSGSFERIARNIDLALGNGVAISIRLNLDRRNVTQLPELAGIFESRGWTQHRRFGVYCAPIRAANANVGKSDTFNSHELHLAVADLRDRFPAISVVQTPSDPVRRAARAVFAGSAPSRLMLKESFCGAHTGMYIFDSFGDIYACWERTGDPAIRMGKIAADGQVELNADVVKVWRTRTVASNPVCNKCKYQFHCGGGCAVLAEAKTGAYHMNYCDAFAARFRSSVAVAYVESLAGTPAQTDNELICDM